MELISKDDRKQIQIDILNDIAMFCDNHNIRFFLAYGTLLGAIRHRGFIPWDDDIDLVMIDTDYTRFIDLYKDDRDPSRYEVFNYQKDMKAFCDTILFTKVFDKRTGLTNIGGESSHGVSVDIFPLCSSSNILILARIKFFICYILRCVYRLNNISTRAMSSHKKWIIRVLKHITGIVKNETIFKLFNHIQNGNNKMEKKYLISPFGVYGQKEIIKRSYFDGEEFMKFEQGCYAVPICWDDWLRQIYGDYMTPPPEKKRTSHSDVPFWR